MLYIVCFLTIKTETDFRPIGAPGHSDALVFFTQRVNFVVAQEL